MKRNRNREIGRVRWGLVVVAAALAVILRGPIPVFAEASAEFEIAQATEESVGGAADTSDESAAQEPVTPGATGELDQEGGEVAEGEAAELEVIVGRVQEPPEGAPADQLVILSDTGEQLTVEARDGLSELKTYVGKQVKIEGRIEDRAGTRVLVEARSIEELPEGAEPGAAAPGADEGAAVPPTGPEGDAAMPGEATEPGDEARSGGQPGEEPAEGLTALEGQLSIEESGIFGMSESLYLTDRTGKKVKIEDDAKRNELKGLEGAQIGIRGRLLAEGTETKLTRIHSYEVLEHQSAFKSGAEGAEYVIFGRVVSAPPEEEGGPERILIVGENGDKVLVNDPSRVEQLKDNIGAKVRLRGDLMRELAVDKLVENVKSIEFVEYAGTVEGRGRSEPLIQEAGETRVEEGPRGEEAAPGEKREMDQEGQERPGAERM